MSILDLPSKKLFIKNLSRARQYVRDPTQNTKIPEWQVTTVCGVIQFSCVWLQGIVVQTKMAGDVLYVDDGTGVVQVTGCDKIPASCPKVKTGQYVMLIGLLMSASTPVIRAIKIQDLSASVNAEVMWPLEVVHQCFVCK